MKTYSLIDSLGTLHTFNEVPQRIISLVPSQTELLIDLGLESKLVGITKFCIHPEDLRSKKQLVGGTKKVNFDKIKALKPDIIICNKEENTLEIVERLQTICKVWVTDVFTIEDNSKMIYDFGAIFNCVTEAQNWNEKIAFALSDFKNFIANAPSKKVAYFIWKNPYMVAASNTFIDELLQLNCFENHFANQSRYPIVNLETINANNDLDFVFLSSEPYPFNDKDALEMSAFVAPAKIILVDGEMFSWYGTRLLKALKYFRELHKKL